MCNTRRKETKFYGSYDNPILLRYNSRMKIKRINLLITLSPSHIKNKTGSKERINIEMNCNELIKDNR